MARTRVRWARVGGLALAAGIGTATLAGHAGAGASPVRPVAAHVHQVRPGETLWSIARSVVGPDGDPRPEVDALISANGLHDGLILPGQRLLVP